MGLHDELRFDYPLPDPEYQNKIFHLKILNCDMDRYAVSESGRLLKEVSGNFFDGEPKVLDPPVDTYFHGDLSFEGVIGELPLAIVYQGIIRFTEGQLQWIKAEKKPFVRYSSTLVF